MCESVVASTRHVTRGSSWCIISKSTSFVYFKILNLELQMMQGFVSCPLPFIFGCAGVLFQSWGPGENLRRLYKSLTQNWELCFLIAPVKSTICSPSPCLTVSLVTSGNWLKIIITSNIYFSLYIYSSYVLGTVHTLSYILWNLNLATALWRMHFYFLHFAGQETNLSKVKEGERRRESWDSNPSHMTPKTLFLPTMLYCLHVWIL